MFWNKKKKKEQPKGPVVWMIQKVGSKPALFLGVCKDKLVVVSNWKAAFRLSDIDSAGLMIYWLMQSKQAKLGEYEAVPVQLMEATSGN